MCLHLAIIFAELLLFSQLSQLLDAETETVQFYFSWAKTVLVASNASLVLQFRSVKGKRAFGKTREILINVPRSCEII